MKQLIVVLIVLFSAACQIDNEIKFEVPESENNVNGTTQFYHNVWEMGLVDHKLNNASLPTEQKVLFSDLQNLAYSTTSFVFSKTHFKLKKDNTSDLFVTLNSNWNSIDGIFMGIVKPTSQTSNELEEELIISFVKADSIRIPEYPNCLGMKMKYVKFANQLLFYKCTNRDAGTWVRLSPTNKLITSFMANKRGYFIGKTNLYESIYKVTDTMYFYIGHYQNAKGALSSVREMVAVDKPYFTNLPIVNSGNGTETKIAPNPIYLSTLKGLQVNCLNLPQSNHGTIRPCPNSCPEEV